MQYCGVSDSLMLYQKLHQYKYTNWIDISMENKLYNFKNTPFTETFFNNLNYCINAIKTIRVAQNKQSSHQHWD